MYKVKKVPASILSRFREAHEAGVEFRFYWYKGEHGKCYGAEVFRNGEYYSNAYQIYA